MAAGLAPALRAKPGWTVIETRADTASYQALRDAIEIAEDELSGDASPLRLA